MVQVIALVALLLGGCLSVAREPALPMPERPEITFYRTPAGICTTEPEAEQMVKWLLKLNEFDAARQRLLRE